MPAEKATLRWIVSFSKCFYYISKTYLFFKKTDYPDKHKEHHGTESLRSCCSAQEEGAPQWGFHRCFVN